MSHMPVWTIPIIIFIKERDTKVIAYLNLFLWMQEMQMPNIYTDLQYPCPYPPLEVEDFPQINIAETKPSKPDNLEESLMYDKYYRDYMNGTLEEIFYLCASQDNSMALTMQEWSSDYTNKSDYTCFLLILTYKYKYIYIYIINGCS